MEREEFNNIIGVFGIPSKQNKKINNKKLTQ